MAAILIAGCGYVGGKLATTLSDHGHQVWGLRRDVSKLPQGVQPFAADLSVAAGLAALPPALDAVVFTAAPDESSDSAYQSVYVDGLRRLLDAATATPDSPTKLVLVSSTAVYGQDDGGWVDERSPTEPRRFSGKRLLESEAVARSSGMQTTIIRFAGIYGPGRSTLIRRVHRGEATLSRSPRYTNRIHRDDCVGVLAHLLDEKSSVPTVIGVDDDPAESNEVIHWLSRRLGVTPTKRDDENENSHNKRCSNALLKSIGYRFRWPSYRDGYPDIIEEYLSGLKQAGRPDS